MNNKLLIFIKKQKIFTKLFLLFSLAFVAILLILMLFINNYIKDDYAKSFLESADLSFTQTNEFIKNYTNNMLYASDMLYYNAELQRILSSENFSSGRDLSEEYREYLMLNNVFAFVEMIETIYSAAIFIPSDISYTNNLKNFFPISQLHERDDYDDLTQSLEKNGIYFSAPEKSADGQDNIVTLFRYIRNLNNNLDILAVEKISIDVRLIQEVLDTSNIAKSGVVFLFNEQNELIAYSGTNSGNLTQTQIINKIDTEIKTGLGAIDDRPYFMWSSIDEVSKWNLVAAVPQSEVDIYTNRISNFILIVIAVAILLVFLIAYFVSKHYGGRFAKLNERIRLVQKGLFDLPKSEMDDDEMGEISRNFDYMAKEIKVLLKKEYKSGKAIKSAQFKALQAQINPHFLYNTLDMINWKAMENGVPDISELVQSLAKFYRLSLNKGDSFTTIKDELSHIEEYIKIQNFNMDNEIKLFFNVPKEILNYKCLNIIFQPLVENSIMHGIDINKTPKSITITIEIYEKNDDIVILITDNGIGMSKEKVQNIFAPKENNKFHGYALHNINDRIKLQFGEEYALVISSEPNIGTTAKINIPKVT